MGKIRHFNNTYRRVRDRTACPDSSDRVSDEKSDVSDQLFLDMKKRYPPRVSASRPDHHWSFTRWLIVRIRKIWSRTKT